MKDELNRLHDFVQSIDAEILPPNNMITEYLHAVLDHMSCLMRDLSSGYVNYTLRPSDVVNLQDKKLFVQAIRSAMSKGITMIDDAYCEKLYAPLWVCRHKMSNGQEFWALSNIAMELTLLLGTVSSTATILSSNQMIAQ